MHLVTERSGGEVRVHHFVYGGGVQYDSLLTYCAAAVTMRSGVGCECELGLVTSP